MAAAKSTPAKTTTAKQTLTESLVDQYFEEAVKVEKAKAALKPAVDKCNSLYEQIETLFLKSKRKKLTLGKWLLSLATKPGSMKWKDELLKRISSDELKKLQAAVPDKLEVEIMPA